MVDYSTIYRHYGLCAWFIVVKIYFYNFPQSGEEKNIIKIALVIEIVTLHILVFESLN